MTWTASTPTEPGYYWLRPHNGKTIVEIRSRSGHMWIVSRDGGPWLCVKRYTEEWHVEWAGPIAPPEELSLLGPSCPNCSGHDPGCHWPLLQAKVYPPSPHIKEPPPPCYRCGQPSYGWTLGRELLCDDCWSYRYPCTTESSCVRQGTCKVKRLTLRGAQHITLWNVIRVPLFAER